MTRTRTIGLCLLLIFSSNASAQEFGGEIDVNYARDLWQAMVDADYAGADARMSRPYPGQHPHGAILDTIEGKITIRKERLHLVVKRNYSGQGISLSRVSSDPDRYLKGITIMLKRPGYDPGNQDWFWAKYRPDGSLDVNAAGTRLAGKIAKGKAKGCIACHSAAPGGDMLFIRN